MPRLASSSLRDPLPEASRYELLCKIASGGMASVHVGRLRGPAGFWRLVAIKRAHAHLLEDLHLRRMLIAEGRLASKIHHPHVVAVIDVEQLDQEILLVMDYVEGASLSEILSIAARDGAPIPPPVALRIGLDACAGLAAAHGLTDELGRPLGIIHRDVSPQNILVGVDGLTRITDFGIARCQQEGTHGSTTGALKGKVAYMAPEYIDHGQLSPGTDVFSLGVVLWEALTNRRLFRGASEIETLRRVLHAPVPVLSEAAPWIGDWLDGVLARTLERSAKSRFPNARALAEALEAAMRAAGQAPASPAEVGALVRRSVGDKLDERRAILRDLLADPPLSAAKAWAGRSTLTLPAAILPQDAPAQEATLQALDTAPADTAPADTAPADTAPADTAPADTAPADTAPADTAPADTAPADTAPADTAPADTAPADTAPADTGVDGGARPRRLIAFIAAAAAAIAVILLVTLRRGPPPNSTSGEAASTAALPPVTSPPVVGAPSAMEPITAAEPPVTAAEPASRAPASALVTSRPTPFGARPRSTRPATRPLPPTISTPAPNPYAPKH